jgi:ABC-type phosphate/phosphonate transport system substrate-binding protein
MIKKILTSVSALAFLVLIGCSSSDSQVKKENQVKPEPVPVITQIKISPASEKVIAGKTAMFIVSGVDAKGKTVAVIANWKLSGAKTVVGNLDSAKGDKVVFSGNAAGTVTLEAEFNNMKATALIQVIKK